MTADRHGSPTGRLALRGAWALALAVVAGWFVWMGSSGDNGDAAPPHAPIPAALPVAAAPAAQLPPESAPEPAGQPPVSAAPEPERIAIRRPLTDLDPETRARLEARLDRERAADERFEQGLEGSQVRGRDIDARVRDAFQRVDLEPELLDGGLMRGLRIRSVEGGSALHEAGFRAGDLLIRLDDRTLQDPAELPQILASAGPRLSLCALRGTTELCRELSLR